MKNILKKPIITEKTMANGEYAFIVEEYANKTEIAKAIKEVFNVDTVSVRTSILKGKTRRAYKTRKSIPVGNIKKAIIKLKAGQKIDIFETGGKVEEKK